MMAQVKMTDLSTRLGENPLLKPGDIKPTSYSMKIECLLNPGVFRFNNKIWLLLRVAERPEQSENKVSFPLYNEKGEIEVLSFDKSDPDLDFTDPRVIRYKGCDYLTTLSHLRLVCSDDGKRFYEPKGYATIFGTHKLEAYGIEDCRVVEIDGVYNLTYTMVSHYGVGVGLIRTRDWKHFDRDGMIFPPHN